jgi:hypothetical protein
MSSITGMIARSTRSGLNQGGNEHRVGSEFLHELVGRLFFYREALPFHSKHNPVLSTFWNNDEHAIIENSPDSVSRLLVLVVAQIDDQNSVRGKRSIAVPVEFL